MPDFPTLHHEGIRQLERLAGGQRTDFNAHDPGITVLEQLCYGLTDKNSADLGSEHVLDVLPEPANNDTVRAGIGYMIINEDFIVAGSDDPASREGDTA